MNRLCEGKSITGAISTGLVNYMDQYEQMGRGDRRPSPIPTSGGRQTYHLFQSEQKRLPADFIRRLAVFTTEILAGSKLALILKTQTPTSIINQVLVL